MAQQNEVADRTQKKLPVTHPSPPSIKFISLQKSYLIQSNIDFKDSSDELIPQEPV